MRQKPKKQYVPQVALLGIKWDRVAVFSRPAWTQKAFYEPKFAAKTAVIHIVNSSIKAHISMHAKQRSSTKMSLQFHS